MSGEMVNSPATQRLLPIQTSRPPSRYEPERLAASRLITDERRRECYDNTLGGQHRCFSCLALLCFTMRETSVAKASTGVPCF
jgi:hypothetical protein